MDRRTLASNLYRRVFLCVLFFVAASASFHGFYSKWHFREPGVAGGVGATPEWRFGLADVIEGTALRPFVYRQLLPAIANWADSKTPQSIKDRLYLSASKEIDTQEFIFVSPMARNPVYFFRYLVLYGLTFFFAWLAVVAMYMVCKAVGLPLLARVAAPVLMILLMPYFLSIGGYYYDYPELAFMALAVWMAIEFDWWWMLPLVALATLNKESFLLMIPTFYPILRKRASHVSALIGTAASLLTSVSVYLLVRLHYAHNPGGTVVSKWRAQLNFFLHPSRYFAWERTYGIPTFKVFTLIPLLVIGWTALRGWKLLPSEIRRHGQIAAVINFPLFFLFCAPGEVRDLSMLYVLFMLLMAASLTAQTGTWFGLDRRHLDEALETETP